MPASASVIRMVSLVTTRIVEGCKWRQIDARGYFDADVATLIIPRFSPSYVFLGRYPDPPQCLTLVSVILCRQFRATTITLRPRLRPIRLLDQLTSLMSTIQNLLLPGNYMYYSRLCFRGFSSHKIVHPSR